MPSADSEQVPRDLLIEVLLDAWKLSQAFARLIARLSPEDGARYAGQLRYFHKRASDLLGEAGLKLVVLDGQPFEPGAAASPLNIADFSASDELIVAQTIEPIILDQAGSLIRPGTVILSKVGAV